MKNLVGILALFVVSLFVGTAIWFLFVRDGENVEQLAGARNAPSAAGSRADDALSAESASARRESARGAASSAPDAGALPASSAPRPVPALLPQSTLSGTVVEASTALPVSGAAVGTSELGHVVTDAQGHFRIAGITASASIRTIEARAHGFSPTYLNLRFDGASAEQSVKLELQRALTLRGTVVDETEQPLAAATIEFATRVASSAFSSETQAVTVSSAVDGHFEFDEARPGSVYTLTLRKASLGARQVEVGPFGADQTAVDLGAFVLEPPASISGRVDGLEPEQVAWVRLAFERASNDPSTSARKTVAATRSTPAGGFSFAQLSSGVYWIEVLDPASKSKDVQGNVVGFAPVELNAGEELTELVVYVTKMAVIGRVSDEQGRPLASMDVTMSARGNETVLATTSTDREGAFRLGAFEFGPYRLKISDPTQRLTSQTVEDVLAGPTEVRIKMFPFVSQHRIDGRVLGPDGKAVKEVFVTFTNSVSGERLGRVGVPDESSGAFSMLNLEDVPYTLEILDFPSTYQPLRREGVRPGTGEVEFRLELRK